jgi:Short C-terminal domain
MPATSYGLGLFNVNGSLIENTDDGTVQYVANGKLLPAFNLRLADVTGVSGQGKGWLKVLMRVYGQGTVLAEVEVNQGTTELVAEWFKSRIGLGATRVVATDSPGMTEELTKLAALRRDGILSEEEFVAAKRKLVGLS